MNDSLTSETEIEDLFSPDIPKGIVLEIVDEGYKVKDVLTKNIFIVTQPNFDYHFACQLLKMTDDSDSLWIISYDPITKVYQES